MLEILNIDPNFILFKIINNKKEILNKLGIRPNGGNEFKITNNLFVIKTLLQYTENKNLEILAHLEEEKWKKLEEKKLLIDTAGNSKLRHYQRVDVAIIKENERFGLFNEMRTGKTPTILTALTEMKKERVLFVVPKSTIMLTWIPEIKSWTSYDCIVIKDDNVKIRAQKYLNFAKNTNCALVVSKNTIRNDIKNGLITTNDFVLVIDEAHFLRNYKTIQTIALLELAKQIKTVYCLTGTPANNHPSDVFGILKVLDYKLYEHINYWEFVERYFGIFKKRISHHTTINIPKSNIKNELVSEFDYIVKKISIMRKQIDIRKEMPKIIHNDVILPMTNEQEKLYWNTFNTMKNELFYDKNAKVTFLEIFTKLRTICATPINEGVNDIGAKYQWITDYLLDNTVDSIIIYSNFSNKGLNILSSILTNHKIKHHLIVGATKIEARFQAINDFQQGNTKVILCNIKTTNVGVSLDRGEVMIFLDRNLNPTENEQAESRFFPTQLTDNKTRQIINLYCENTIDLKIKAMVEQKIDINKIINEQGIKFFE